MSGRISNKAVTDNSPDPLKVIRLISFQEKLFKDFSFQEKLKQDYMF